MAKFIPTHVPEVRPSDWVPVNRASFPDWIRATFRYPTPDARTGLFAHQRFVRDFLQAGGPNRGLMLYHGLGVGKTAASIAIADALMGEGKEAIVMLPAFLRNNYVMEVMRYGSPLFRQKQRWGFVPTRTGIEKIEVHLRLPKGYAKSAGGLWVPVDLIQLSDGLMSPSRRSIAHFDDLTDDQREVVTTQLRAMVEGYYRFIHYNGLRRDSISQLTSGNTVNPFSNTVVVIDEVHNFISRVAGGGLVAPMIYQLLMDAEKCKIIALSGTPIINHPHELAILVNLIRGPLVRHVLRFNISAPGKGKSDRPFDDKAVAEVMGASARVDEYAIDVAQRAITFTLLPDGFAFTSAIASHVLPKSMVRRMVDTEPLGEEQAVVDHIASELKSKAGVRLSAARGAIKRESIMLLPATSEEFNKLFIDFDTNRVRNSDMLARRLQGQVSYFRVYSPDMYPRVSDPVIVETLMSKRQFEGYSEVRDIERQGEERARRRQQRGRGSGENTKDVFKDTSNTYRCFSRAVCNFVFPKDVARPYPSKLSQVRDELDDPDFDETAAANAEVDEGAGAGDDKLIGGGEWGASMWGGVVSDTNRASMPRRQDTARAYQAALARSLKQLKAGSRKWLGPAKTAGADGGLPALSPKFAAVIEQLQDCPGCALVYSTFRNVEGLGVLSMALDAHGWKELLVFKNPDDGGWDVDVGTGKEPLYVRFVGEREYAQIVMDIYNSEFERLPERVRNKVLAVSGVDRNMRGEVVRLMMITQSGSEGISLRNVRQVHIIEPYWNQVRLDQVMGRAVRAGSHLALPYEERSVKCFVYMSHFTPEQARAMRSDDGRTSDEFIYGVAQRKAAIVDSVLGVVRASAVDSQLYPALDSGAAKTRAISSPRKERGNTGMAYPNDIGADLQDADVVPQQRRIVQVSKTLVAATIRGVRYAYDADEGTLYDYIGAQEQPPKLVPLGRVEKAANGKTRVHMFAAS